MTSSATYAAIEAMRATSKPMQDCSHCSGTGSHMGVKGGPNYPLCGFCGGSGRVPAEAPLPDPKDIEITSLRARLEAAERERDDARARSDANADHARLANASFNSMNAARAANLSRAEAAEKRADRYKDALTVIAHTFTEDSHGNMKTLPAHDYQQIALDALSKQEER